MSAPRGIEATLRIFARQIHELNERSVTDMAEAGALLLRAKALVSHGRFLAFVRQECGMHARKAQRLIGLTQFYQKYSKMATWSFLSVSAAERIAEAKAPIQLRVIDLILKHGKRVNVRDVERILAEHRRQARYERQVATDDQRFANEERASGGIEDRRSRDPQRDDATSAAPALGMPGEGGAAAGRSVEQAMAIRAEEALLWGEGSYLVPRMTLAFREWTPQEQARFIRAAFAVEGCYAPAPAGPVAAHEASAGEVPIEPVEALIGALLSAIPREALLRLRGMMRLRLRVDDSAEATASQGLPAGTADSRDSDEMPESADRATVPSVVQVSPDGPGRSDDLS